MVKVFHYNNSQKGNYIIHADNFIDNTKFSLFEDSNDDTITINSGTQALLWKSNYIPNFLQSYSNQDKIPGPIQNNGINPEFCS